ncbi:adenine deaminase [Solirubrobacter sp. CPCC 204708]|uniref:Adenine deaminase n=1 Tax=Solirubrobacter deserti TaxID=2282478 RepID=A0ABT4RQR7_9ACTN|nr:adenine deaminase [Solirubrobacter deserti]MBE2320688.1 adenine deaminase [Solirubrobacter deserti]MDA0140913.1 adenine deaminase [Solirubrobacter deserti]
MKELIAVARGDAEPDTVITGARVFSAFTREWLSGDVALHGGKIAGVGSYDGGERIDAGGRYLVPGFIDAHVHLESAKLVPVEFARAVVPRGTTAVVCDPHEIANVAGVEGVEWLLSATDELPLDVFVMAPSCVPASGFESPCGPFGPDEMRRVLEHPRALGVAELMNFPGVIAGDPDVLATMVAAHRDGHAPGVRGRALNAYVAAGISTDHEAFTAEEALEKRRAGMWVLIREASNARNLRALLAMVREHGPDYCAFCTDDREPDFLFREGHLDQMCRVAVSEGVAAEEVLVMASLHGARAHGLLDRGAVAPGYVADLVLLDDLVDFHASLVLKGGREPVYAAGVPGELRDTMRSVPVSFGVSGDWVRVIEIEPGQLITGAGVGRVGDADLAKIAVIERHHATGRVGLGFVRGFGLRAGAFASTVAHDAHNLVVVGVDDGDMALCAARAQELGGGLVVARDGEVMGELALPIAGLLADAPLEEVAEGLEGLQDVLRGMGVEIDAPFMTLSFLALSVIPSLKITDQGLVDVDAFRLVDLELSEREAFVARFGGLYEHSPWVAERAFRPGIAHAEVADALREAMYAASEAEQFALIRAHPDLGERVGVLTAHSRAEQAGLGLDRLEPELYERFMATNAAYRERFGIPFVVCVREHGSAESILANADARLGNTREQEIATALGEIAKIARLRLDDVV